MVNKDTKIWSFKYEPNKFNDLILNKDIKIKLRKALKEVPNLMIYGTPGVGKGTFANILLKYTKYNSLWINASDHTGIDFIRDTVKPFANAASLTDMKIIVMNESDSLTAGNQGSQKMLKQLMEDVHKITRFIFLTNDITIMMDELQSRCTVIKVDNPPAKEIAKFCVKILLKEKVKFKTKTIVSIVKKCYPDIRKTISALQENSINGNLISDNTSSSEPLWEKIMNLSIQGNIEEVRKEIKSNYIDYNLLFKYFYDNSGRFKEPGGAILTIGDHLRWNRTYPIPEINFMHMIVNMIYENII